ncbi:hypothetical protein [Halorussus aquaticus]|uniref:DUF3784 domain-containing protein n=1 Tax=Halorussus aquaticus TaxID=2953748 RepID=A0ABD5PXE6_9EURY|nr:hypothetical protein [Halorussus aquaticus]
MAQVLSTAWATLLLGAAIVAVGYLVKYRQWTTLVVGSAPFDSTDPSPVFASYAGNVTLVAGGFVVCMGVAQSLGLLALVPGWLQGLLFVGAVVLVAPRLGVVATER